MVSYSAAGRRSQGARKGDERMQAEEERKMEERERLGMATEAKSLSMFHFNGQAE